MRRAKTLSWRDLLVRALETNEAPLVFLIDEMLRASTGGGWKPGSTPKRPLIAEAFRPEERGGRLRAIREKPEHGSDPRKDFHAIPSGSVAKIDPAVASTIAI